MILPPKFEILIPKMLKFWILASNLQFYCVVLGGISVVKRDMKSEFW